MSGFRRPGSARGIDSLSDLLNDSLSCDTNKPDSREPDVVSPVFSLRTTRPTGTPFRSGPTATTSAPTSSTTTTNTTTTTTTTSSSSSSSGSVSGRIVRSPLGTKSHSDDLGAGSGEGSRRPGHVRSNSSGSVGLRPGGGRSSSNSSGGGSGGGGGGGGSVSSPPVNVLPAGNIIPSGRIPRTGLTREPPRRDVLGSGKGNYGHGSIMRGGGGGSPGVGSRGSGGGAESEEWNSAGHEAFEKGNYAESLRMFDRAIASAPDVAAYRMNRATALEKMGRTAEAVDQYEVALRLDSHCLKIHHLMGRLLLRLGQVEVARKQFCFPGVIPSDQELQRLEAIETHLQRCGDARKKGDWIKALEETEATLAAGAYYSPQLLACRAECRIKLLQIDDANSIIAEMGIDTPVPHCCSNTRFFGMLSEAYPLFVRAQIDLAYGRFADASFAAKKALGFEPKNGDVTALVNKVETVTRARSRGNELVESNRLTEACAAYDEGLAVEPFNAILHSNKAACSYMLKKWEQCVDDCSNALLTRPNYVKALQRRAFSYLQLEKWAQAIQDYEVLIQQCPDNQEYKEGLTKANVAWMKSQEGLVQEIVSLEQFRNVMSAKGVFVVHFFEKSESDNSPYRLVSSIMDVLKNMYPAVTFLKVDMKQSSQISNVENVYTASTVRIYKDGSSVKEVLNPTLDVLGDFVRYYSKERKA
ncbi:hypothetical protein Dimus_018862 [Dionaea muscipula]